MATRTSCSAPRPWLVPRGRGAPRSGPPTSSRSTRSAFTRLPSTEEAVRQVASRMSAAAHLFPGEGCWSDRGREGERLPSLRTQGAAFPPHRPRTSNRGSRYHDEVPSRAYSERATERSKGPRRASGDLTQKGVGAQDLLPLYPFYKDNSRVLCPPWKVSIAM